MDRETRDMLIETADRFFTERSGRAVVNEVEKGVWPADLWKEIEEMGLTLIAVPEDKGGAGGTLSDMLSLLRTAGSHAVPVPLAETALANLLIAAAGAEPKAGPVTLALGSTLSLSGGRLSGKVERVPFASVAGRFVTVVGSTLAVVAAGTVSIEAKPSHAGEPYGTVTFDNAAAEFTAASAVTADRAFELAAVMRAMQMAGAADTVLATAVEYCKQRVQFGKPISTFQAIQHMLAELASHAAAIIASAETASRDAGWARRWRQLLDRGGQDPGLGLRPAHRRDLAPVDGRHGVHPRAHPASLHAPPLGVAPRFRKRDLLGREDRGGLRQGRPRRAVGLAERQQVRGLVFAGGAPHQ